jgi:hypothetical protein
MSWLSSLCGMITAIDALAMTAGRAPVAKISPASQPTTGCAGQGLAASGLCWAGQGHRSWRDSVVAAGEQVQVDRHGKRDRAASAHAEAHAQTSDRQPVNAADFSIDFHRAFLPLVAETNVAIARA